MVEKEWFFSGTTMYFYDSGSIDLKTSSKNALSSFMIGKGKPRNRMLALTFELQQEFKLT